MYSKHPLYYLALPRRARPARAARHPPEKDQESNTVPDTILGTTPVDAALLGPAAPFRVLSEDGRSVDGPVPPIGADVMAAMLEEMIKARVASDRLFALQRQGRAGTFPPINGQEAVVVGAAAALDPAWDWVVPQYREPVALGRYGPEVLNRACLYQRGHPGGGHFPPGVRVFPSQISLAAQIPHALGLAWAMQIKGEPGVAVAFFGDGASSEGDFYETGNFAGVLGAPVIFCLVNNGWAISTPVAAQTAARTFAAKASAFGMPGVRVDGNDALAVYSVMAAARKRATNGEGPTLVEAVTFRMGPHTTADDPKRYVPAEERTAWESRDPILRLRLHLEGAGQWDVARQRAAEEAAAAAIDEAWAAAEATPLAPDAFFDHVYAEPTPRMRTQRAELRARLSEQDL
jgi:pyruvate dehydrogenase E1 component alpha subunit